MDSKIIVVIRKRPLGKKELAKGDQDIVDVRDESTIIVKEIKQKVDLTKFVEEHNFNFDLAIDQGVSNEEIYMKAVRPILEAAFNKYRVTCFAYGQTGSGKTYTMLGDPDCNVPGLYLLASHDLFAILQQSQYQNLYVVISFYEIYCGKLFDLLNGRTQLQSREDAKGNVNIIGLTEKKINNVQQLMQVIQNGQNQRVTSSNSANSESSRSHALLQISLKQGKSIHGKLSFIDLAGSERGADVQDQNKQTRIDGAEINKSLLALKECIRAIDLNKNHTPFRGSKLTQVLKDSFTGNCKTVMIGNISPSNASSEHTLNTLRYADRVKELKRGADQKGLTQEEIMAKELMLARQQNNVTKKVYKNPDDDDDDEDLQPYNQKMNQGQQGINQNGIGAKNNNQNNTNLGMNNQLYQQQQYQPQPYPQYQQQTFTQQQTYQSNYSSNSLGFPPQQQLPQQLNLQNFNRSNSFQEQNFNQNQIQNQSQNQQQINKAASYQYQGQQTNMQTQQQSLINNKNQQLQQQYQNQLLQSQQQQFINQSLQNPSQNKKNPQLPPTMQQQKQIQAFQQQNFNIQPINQQQFPNYQQSALQAKQQMNNNTVKGQSQQQQMSSLREINQLQDQDEQLSAQSEELNQDDDDLVDQNMNSNSSSQNSSSLQNYYNQQGTTLGQYIAEPSAQEFSKQQPQIQQQFTQSNQSQLKQPQQQNFLPPSQVQLNQFTSQQQSMNPFLNQTIPNQTQKFQQGPNNQLFSSQQAFQNPLAYQQMLQRQQEQQLKQEQLRLLTQQHEVLVQKILQNEEDVIAQHRDHIDVMVNITKQDMLLLNQIENPGSDISQYINSLNKLLEEKISYINQLKSKIQSFQELLTKEEQLSQQFYNERQQMLLEMKSGEESQLLDNL